MIGAGVAPRQRFRFATSAARVHVARTCRVLGSHGVMVLACVVVLLPFIWVLLSSFKTIPDFYHWPPSFWPKQFTLAHYAYAFGHFPLLWGYYVNSWVITPTTVAAVVVISTMAGYAFARLPFRVSKGIFIVMVATLFFPVQIISVFVMYQLTSAMGLIDTRLGLILAYTSLLLPVYIFIMRTVFAALPGEIEEAAKVDGASNWQVFRKVMLPLAKPGIAVVVILSFVNVWGEYLWAETLDRFQSNSDWRRDHADPDEHGRDRPAGNDCGIRHRYRPAGPSFYRPSALVHGRSARTERGERCLNGFPTAPQNRGLGREDRDRVGEGPGPRDAWRGRRHSILGSVLPSLFHFVYR